MCTPRHTAESFHAICWHWHAKLAHAQVLGQAQDRGTTYIGLNANTLSPLRYVANGRGLLCIKRAAETSPDKPMHSHA
jgi:hypothetical protein